MPTLSRSLVLFPLVAVLSCASTPRATDSAVGTRNADLARAGYAAFARGDMPAVLALMAPTIVWHEAASLPYGGVYNGPDAVLQNVFMKLGSDWTTFAASPREYILAGDRVVVLGEYSGTNRHTGRSFTSPFAHVWRFDNGRLVEFKQFTDTALWLASIVDR